MSRFAKFVHPASVLTAAIALVGCGSSAEKAPTAKPIPSVRVAVIQSTSIAPVIEGIGTAVWRRETPLGFTTGGQIARIFVNEGDRVGRGQLLALLSTTPVEADLAAAQAEAKRAGSEVARMETLYRQGWVTKARLEAAQANAQSSSAQVNARRFALDTAKVVAPSAGVVLARLAEPTQVVAAGTPVVIIGETSGGYVIRVPVNDRVAAALKIGAPANVRFEALGSAPLTGQIVEIGSKSRQTTGTFDVEISLPNNPRLRSGMIGSVSMLASNRDAVRRITIPAAALISPRADEALVYLVDAENRVRLHKISLGATTDAGVDILGGLSGGERVVLTGFDRIKDGSRVTPVMPTP